MIDLITNYYFSAAGILGITTSACIFLLAMFKLMKRVRVISLLFLLSFLALFFFRPTNYIAAYVANTILLMNSGFYVICIMRFAIRSHLKRKPPKPEHKLPSISILIPSKNESAVLADTIDSLRGIDYPIDQHDILIIDDGSTDNTKQILKAYQFVENLSVIRNEKSVGKSKAVNQAIETIQTDLVLILDADHFVEPDFLTKASIHFKDPKTACVQGKNVIRNGHASLLSKLIEMEYAGRYEVLYAGRKMALFLGSGGIFRTNHLKSIGGFTEEMLTEDLEATYKTYEKGLKVKFDPGIATHELATVDYQNFFKQRHRWFRGIWQSFAAHVGKMTKKGGISHSTRLGFFHIVLENLALIAYLYLNVMFAFNFFGIAEMNLNLGLFVQTIVTLLVVVLAILKSRKLTLLLFTPLIIFYYIIYALPNIMAILDNAVLKSKYLWVKTDRKNTIEPQVQFNSNKKKDNKIIIRTKRA